MNTGVILAWFIIFFLAIRCLVALINLITFRKKFSTDLPDNQPFISVLVPARNEEENIGKLIRDIEKQKYQHYEVLVYDDASTDNTAEIVKSHALKNQKIRLIVGTELPAGWIGKNYACHMLATHASGDYFLFLDADVQIEDNLFNETINYINKKNISLLSIFPQQIMLSKAEKLTVPLMNWILVSLLPLILTRISKRHSFSAANGQFMLFNAKIYREHFFHQIVKLNAVEDIQIFRMMKKMKYRTETLLSNGQIKCRMYKTFNEAAEGFSKNIPAFFGGSMVATILFTLITTFGWLAVLLFTSTFVFLGYLIATLFLRVIISLASRQSWIDNVLLAPFQQLVFAWLAFRSVIYKAKGKTNWKGRTYTS